MSLRHNSNHKSSQNSSQTSSQPTAQTRSQENRRQEIIDVYSSDSDQDSEDSLPVARRTRRLSHQEAARNRVLSSIWSSPGEPSFLSPTSSQLDAMLTPPAEQIDPYLNDSASQTRAANTTGQLSQTILGSSQGANALSQMSDVDARRKYFAANIKWPTMEQIKAVVVRIIVSSGRKALDLTIPEIITDLEAAFHQLRAYGKFSREAAADVEAFWRRHTKLISDTAIEETELCREDWPSTTSESVEEAIEVEDDEHDTDATQANLAAALAPTPSSPRIKLEDEEEDIHISADGDVYEEDGAEKSKVEPTEESVLSDHDIKEESIDSFRNAENLPNGATEDAEPSAISSRSRPKRACTLAVKLPVEQLPTKNPKPKRRADTKPKPEPQPLTKAELKKIELANKNRGDTPPPDNFKFHMKYTAKEDTKLLKLVDTVQPQGDPRRWELIAQEMERTVAGVRQRYYALKLTQRPKRKRTTIETSWTITGTFRSGIGYLNMIIDALESNGGQATRHEIMKFIATKYDKFLNHETSSKGTKKWKRAVYSNLERSTRIKKTDRDTYELAKAAKDDSEEKSTKPTKRKVVEDENATENVEEAEDRISPPEPKRRKV